MAGYKRASSCGDNSTSGGAQFLRGHIDQLAPDLFRIIERQSYIACDIIISRKLISFVISMIQSQDRAVFHEILAICPESYKKDACDIKNNVMPAIKILKIIYLRGDPNVCRSI